MSRRRPADCPRALRRADRPRALRRPLLLPAHLRLREPRSSSAACTGCASAPPRARARRSSSRSASRTRPHVRVGFYSHGMQKRLSVARALLTDPPILLVDEATHDLDPEAARARPGARRRPRRTRRRRRVGDAAARRDPRLRRRGHAPRATDGRAFPGTVPELMALAAPRRYVLRAPQRARRRPGARAARSAPRSRRPGRSRPRATATPSTTVLAPRGRRRARRRARRAHGRRRRRARAAARSVSEIEKAFLALTPGSVRSRSTRRSRGASSASCRPSSGATSWSRGATACASSPTWWG